MKEYIIKITDEEEKVLLTDILDIKIWIENFVNNKARRITDKVCEEYSDKQVKKMTLEEKIVLIRGIPLKTAAEKNLEAEQNII